MPRTVRTLQHISGETQFCAVFNILILTIGSGSHGCSEIQSPHMADQAPRRKLSTSLAVTCIQTSFYIHAMSLFVQLICHVTTTVVMSDTLLITLVQSQENAEKTKILDPTF